jgi:hypothetical protein
MVLRLHRTTTFFDFGENSYIDNFLKITVIIKRYLSSIHKRAMPKASDILLLPFLLFTALALAAAPTISLVSSSGTACPNPLPSIGLVGVRAKPGLPIIPGSYYLVLTLPDATPNTTHGINWNTTIVEKTCDLRINISVDGGSRFRVNGPLTKITPEYQKWVDLHSGSKVRGYLWKPDGHDGMFKIDYSIPNSNGTVSHFSYFLIRSSHEQ